MKLAILRNSDVMEKNGFRIRTQRPKIVWKQVVLLQDKKLVDLCYQLKYSSLIMYVLNINQYKVTFGPVEVVFCLAPVKKSFCVNCKSFSSVNNIAPYDQLGVENMTILNFGRKFL